MFFEQFLRVWLQIQGSQARTRPHTFVKIDHEIISKVILLPSAESFKGLLPVTSESMCTKYWLIACSS